MHHFQPLSEKYVQHLYTKRQVIKDIPEEFVSKIKQNLKDEEKSCQNKTKLKFEEMIRRLQRKARKIWNKCRDKLQYLFSLKIKVKVQPYSIIEVVNDMFYLSLFMLLFPFFRSFNIDGLTSILRFSHSCLVRLFYILKL